MERVQFGAVSVRAASARRTAVPGCAGNPVFADSHYRHETRPTETTDRESHRARRSFRARELFAPAHDSLRSGSYYVSALGTPNGDGPGGIFMLDCETFEVLGE